MEVCKIIDVVVAALFIIATVSANTQGTCAGRDGRDGVPGKDGISGKDGAPGRDGLPGRDGITVIGPPGRDGVDGRDGTDCIECAKGPKGEKGDRGYPGEHGKSGTNGIPGKQGVQGNKGDKGDTGMMGKPASKGEKGDKGVCDEKTLKNIQDSINLLRTDLNRKIQVLENENSALKSRLASLFTANSKTIKYSLLPAGYDQYSLYDILWQSQHMAAAAGCRGSTPHGGTGPNDNFVIPRRKGSNCRETCAASARSACTGEVSISGHTRTLVKPGRDYRVGAFYNYGCESKHAWGVESDATDKNMLEPYAYISHCCCRSP